VVHLLLLLDVMMLNGWMKELWVFFCSDASSSSFPSSTLYFLHSSSSFSSSSSSFSNGGLLLLQMEGMLSFFLKWNKSRNNGFYFFVK
jgi:hypothetical protein